MGTGHPPATVRAATLAGGDANQDRYAYGDGWYAERLRDALVQELTSHPDDPTVDLVARAIDVAASAHDDPQTCPTSTVALARWACEDVEAYVLGDSTAVLIIDEGEEVITDAPLAKVSPAIRAEHRSRLANGHGFDAHHRQLLQDLQSHEAAASNRAGGYWIAGSAPEAATEARTHSRPRSEVRSVLLASDGAERVIAYGVCPTWGDFASGDLETLLHATQELEAADGRATSWPRSKLHDDKTAVAVDLRGRSTR